YGKEQIAHSAFGSTRPELTHAAIGQIEVPVPERKVQRVLARNVEQAIHLYYESINLMKTAVDTYEKTIDFVSADSTDAIFEADPVENDMWTPRHYRPGYRREVERVRENFHCE